MLQAADHSNLRTALAKLRSLHDGDIGVVETVACGNAAIPALKEMLSAREPSGIYEPRRHAVEALAGLQAWDVLRDYLADPKDISDPVERAGEDAVINAAVRALARRPDTRDLPLFFALIRTRPLAGVIEALGKFRQPGALPFFIQALEDDCLRPSAEDAILHLGGRATRLLIHTALDRDPLLDRETPSSIARRRSALRLLEKLPMRGEMLPPAFFRLVEDDDPWIALRATRLCLVYMTEPQAAKAAAGLIPHLKAPDELLAREIENILVDYYALVAAEIAQAQVQHRETVPVWRATDHTHQTLARVKERADKAIRKASNG